MTRAAGRLLVAAACGLLLSVALPPGGVWPLALLLAVPFVLVAATERPRAAFWLGAAFALPFFALYILWLPKSFSQPDMLGPYFWGVFPLLLAALCLFWGGTTALARWIGGRGAGTLWLLAPLWVLVEWARTQGYLGFPWGTLGYLWLDTPVAQLADTVGIYGLSLLVTVVAALLAAPFVPADTVAPVPADAARERLGMRAPPGTGRRRPRRSPLRFAAPVVAVGLVAGAWVWGGRELAAPVAPPDRTAVLVQPNVDPFGRAVSAAQGLAVHARLTRDAVVAMERPPDFVIWPEGALLSYDVEGFRGQETRRAVQASAPGSDFIVGGRALEVDSAGTRDYNSAYSIADGEVVGRYDKAYLVPFGERWPLLRTLAPVYRFVFSLFNLPLLAGTTPGAGPVPLPTPEGPVATYICYESVFPQVERTMVADGARLLVNITNDAWFSRGNGARQHFDMGRMRAIETRRYLLRAGNDGITASIDPRGDVTAALPRHVAAALSVDFAFLDGLTPYVRYGRWYVPGLALATLVVALGQIVRHRRA